MEKMSNWRLVLIPGIITFVVTLLRLIGELNQWSTALFNPEAGGGGAIVGIAWLVPIFGIYFALKLHQANELQNGLRTVGSALMAVAAFFVIGFGVSTLLGLDPNQPSLASLAVMSVASVVALGIAYYRTGTFGQVLCNYGLAARIPVILVMLLAILGNWGTHYDVLPPGAEMDVGPLTKWFFIGVIPQLTFWMAYTIVGGALFGGIALAIAERREGAARTAST